ncbi:HhH-GPD superfamily base excision DNA repair protein [seawater metagenome]|uniref:DNA-(apurinic or apyrimidinic site) lyase n=1 Tax=seawater metagenome TaxID=1561972 RepID=A0A5E8CJ85_9ZZZZ
MQKNFLKTLKIIAKFRESLDAPVDIYGPQAIASKKEGDKVYRYQVLIALMLSSQTKDQITAKTISILQKYGLTPENINNTSVEKINELIKHSGFHNLKSKYIKNTTKIILDEYDSDIPKTLEELIKLPGVGYKMAILAMNIAWKINCGISVDTHVHKVSNRLGWIKTNKAEKTRKELEDWIPKEYWASINPLLVGFGQQVCLPRNPKCSSCPVNKYCAYNLNNKKVDNISYEV